LSKADSAIKFFETRNCAQSVLAAYAADFGLDNDRALQVSVGFGGGFGRLQDICGAINGAVIVLGLSSGFKEEDGRDKINEVYAKVREFIGEFSREHGTIKCRELLDGCDLLSEEGQKIFKDKNLKENCRGYIRLCCELLDKYLK
jgi:C_GCAxxG_C_C family probable redox protein